MDINSPEFDEKLERIKEKTEEMKRQSLEEPQEWPIPDRTVKRWTVHGLKCAVCKGGFSLCGYVHVPAGHPAADMGYDDVDIRVHGGLTFRCRATDGGSWFGFDTGHAGDWLSISIPDKPELGIEMPGRIWTADDVADETEKLAKQLREMGGPDVKPAAGEPGDRPLDLG